jgi:mutator protein MutT
MVAGLVPVGIAVVERNGCYLVGRRADAEPLAGLAEFPGGKCRPDESPRDCSARECLEETGLEVTPLRLLLHRTFTYPHATLDLHFWLCRAVRAETVGEQHRAYHWIPADALERYRFPEANLPLIKMLVRANEAV